MILLTKNVADIYSYWLAWMLDLFIVGDFIKIVIVHHFPVAILLRFCILFRTHAQESHITVFLLNLHFFATAKCSLMLHVGCAGAFLSIIILSGFSNGAFHLINLSTFYITYLRGLLHLNCKLSYIPWQRTDLFYFRFLSYLPLLLYLLIL